MSNQLAHFKGTLRVREGDDQGEYPAELTVTVWASGRQRFGIMRTDKFLALAECPQCVSRLRRIFTPDEKHVWASFWGSKGCECGSIASGGTKPFCTCGTCL